MDLSTITMDRNKAREAFLEYRRAVRDRHDKEDEQIMRGYRALAQGKQLINLPETIKQGGTELKTFPSRWRGAITWRVPRLAVIRADAKICFTDGIRADGGCVFTADSRESELATNNKKDRFRLSRGLFEESDHHHWWGPYLRAIVPSVPPPFRPAHSLRGYLVMWEADWAQAPQPPGDPALLKRIGGDLYAVCAIWDLTELERTVLAARA